MWQHFKKKEFTCKCGCGKNNISEVLVSKLAVARETSGIPFKVNSGCRCYQHNKDVGGSDTSSHLPGFAADLECIGLSNRFIMVEALIDAGIRRIGIGSNFIHADDDPVKDSPVMWLY